MKILDAMVAWCMEFVQDCKRTIILSYSDIVLPFMEAICMRVKVYSLNKTLTRICECVIVMSDCCFVYTEG
jgi:hypothetical protein